MPVHRSSGDLVRSVTNAVNAKCIVAGNVTCNVGSTNVGQIACPLPDHYAHSLCGLCYRFDLSHVIRLPGTAIKHYITDVLALDNGIHGIVRRWEFNELSCHKPDRGIEHDTMHRGI